MCLRLMECDKPVLLICRHSLLATVDGLALRGGMDTGDDRQSWEASETALHATTPRVGGVESGGSTRQHGELSAVTGASDGRGSKSRCRRRRRRRRGLASAAKSGRGRSAPTSPATDDWPAA